jgi:predicted Zn-dependent protease
MTSPVPAATRRSGIAKRLAVTALAACSLAACNQTMPINIGGGSSGSVLNSLSNLTKSAPASGSGAQAGQPNLIQMLQQSFDQIDEKQEIEIGRQLAAVLLGSKPLLNDPPLQRYVNQLGRWISLQSSRPNLPWTFGVLDDRGYNAFATPGGYIFVTKGLIDRVRDESELGGILAHEITHVVSKHHLKAISASARTGVLTSVVASQLKGDLGGQVAQQMLVLGRNLYSRGLDQGDEFEADRRGVALAARAGLDPYGLVSSLQQLRGASSSDASFALTLSTHPPAQARMDKVEAAMGRRFDKMTSGRTVTISQRVGRNREPGRQ